MFVVIYRKFFYILSAILVVGSIISLLVWGLNLGIDFKGGSILEVAYSGARPTKEVVDQKIASLNDPVLAGASVRETGDKGFIIRTKSLTDAERKTLTAAVQDTATENDKVEVKRFDSIGPILGKELVRKSIFSIVLVILAIVLFITYAFRKVSEQVSSWKYGLTAVVCLIHDVIVPAGFFSILDHFKGFEVDTLFITALLVVLGFSVHDTIVVFDRVRENLKIDREYKTKKSFETIVGESVSQTMTRSINTSLTVLLSLTALYFFGAESTRSFSLVMFVGIFAGTYSSIFLGSPLLVTLGKLGKK